MLREFAAIRDAIATDDEVAVDANQPFAITEEQLARLDLLFDRVAAMAVELEKIEHEMGGVLGEVWSRTPSPTTRGTRGGCRYGRRRTC